MTPEMYEDIHSLYRHLYLSWDKDTAYKGEFIPEVPEYGQCAITALIVEERFGGMIVRGELNNGISHYWNLLDTETVVDLTRGQFPIWIQDEYPYVATREELLDNDDTKRRYELLKARVVAREDA